MSSRILFVSPSKFLRVPIHPILFKVKHHNYRRVLAFNHQSLPIIDIDSYHSRCWHVWQLASFSKSANWLDYDSIELVTAALVSVDDNDDDASKIYASRLSRKFGIKAEEEEERERANEAPKRILNSGDSECSIRKLPRDTVRRTTMSWVLCCCLQTLLYYFYSHSLHTFLRTWNRCECIFPWHCDDFNHTHFGMSCWYFRKYNYVHRLHQRRNVQKISVSYNTIVEGLTIPLTK